METSIPKRYRNGFGMWRWKKVTLKGRKNTVSKESKMEMEIVQREDTQQKT